VQRTVNRRKAKNSVPIPPPPSEPSSRSPGPPPQPGPKGPSGPETFQPVAALLAILLPGAGHAFLGQYQRAGFVALGVLGLFFSGLLIGGIDVVDRRQNPVVLYGRPTVNAWFFGQALVGPLTFGVDYLHQNHFKVIDPQTGERRSARPEIRDAEGQLVAPAEIRGPGGVAVPGSPGDRPPNSKALGRMHELGTLFITIAGMLNLIVIMDASMQRRRENDRAIDNARRFLSGRGPGSQAAGGQQHRESAS
jgi:hypothetical protein